MAIDIDIAVYREKIAAFERMLVEKRELLARATDPMVQQTLERTIATLVEMLSIYEKISRNLSEIRRLDARQNKRDLVAASAENLGDHT